MVPVTFSHISTVGRTHYNARLYGGRVGPLATQNCEFRQAWKGATVVVARAPRCGWHGRRLNIDIACNRKSPSGGSFLRLQ
jgi:hypothetical protein